MVDDGDGSSSARLRRSRRRRFKLVLLAVAVLGVEASSAAVLAIRPRPFGPRVVRLSADYAEQAEALREYAAPPPPNMPFVFDPELGWTVRRGLTNDHDVRNWNFRIGDLDS